MAEVAFVLSQCTRLTDRKTDRHRNTAAA